MMMLQMTLRKACAAGLLCLLPLAGAGAQTITIQRPGVVDPNAGPIRVQFIVNFFMPGPANDSEQANMLPAPADRSMSWRRANARCCVSGSPRIAGSKA
jgi:hypothetical protein